MDGVQKQLNLVALLILVMMVALASNNNKIGLVCNAQNICNMTYPNLMACKPAVTPPNPPNPTAGCCSPLSHADLKCLCSYKNSPVLPSLGIDPNLATKLPEKCNLPPPSNC